MKVFLQKMIQIFLLVFADVSAWIASILIYSNDLKSININGLIGLITAWLLMVSKTYYVRHNLWLLIQKLFKYSFVMVTVIFFINLFEGDKIYFLNYILWGITFMNLLIVFRWSAITLMIKFKFWMHPFVLIGRGLHLADIKRALKEDNFLGYYINSVVELAPNQNIEQIVNSNGIFKYGDCSVVLVLENISSKEREDVLRCLLRKKVNKIHLAQSLQSLPVFNLELTSFFAKDFILLNYINGLSKASSLITKRIFDITLSLLIIVLISPLLILLLILIGRDGSKVIYGHERIGKNGVPFKCYKFRSMVPGADKILEELISKNKELESEWKINFKLKDDPRITKVGKFIRRTSLDELPQLINVLHGSMSLVGPRPITRQELEKYGHDIEYYLAMKPGITGIWQVSGRSETNYDKRVKLDLWYFKNWSIWLDLEILFKTINVVLKKEGAY